MLCQFIGLENFACPNIVVITSPSSFHVYHLLGFYQCAYYILPTWCLLHINGGVLSLTTLSVIFLGIKMVSVAELIINFVPVD